MNKRLAPASKSATISVPPTTVRQFAVDQGEYLIEHLENLVDSMVTGDMPRRHMLLIGPLASGKRALARAIAAEFCTRVVELDPSGATREDDIEEILRGMRDGDILLVHNIDEFPPPGIVPIYRAIVTGKVTEQGSPYSDGFEDPGPGRRRAPVAVPMQRLAGVTVIATTNAAGAVAASVHEACMRIVLHRSVSGVRSAIARSLTARGISCSDEARDLIASVVMAALDDIFEDTMAMAIASCNRDGTSSIDIERARKIASTAWSLMPDMRAADSLRKAAEAAGVKNSEICERLCVPAAIARDVRTNREKPKNPGRFSEALEDAEDAE